jgi:hypothetical protein
MNKQLHGIRPPPQWLNVSARTKFAFQEYFRSQRRYGYEQIYMILGAAAILLTAAGIWWIFWMGGRS